MAMKNLNSKIQSVRSNNLNSTKSALNNLRANNLSVDTRIDKLNEPTFIASNKYGTKYESDGKIEIYTGNPEKTKASFAIEVPIEISYSSNQEFPVKIETTTNNVRSGGEYHLKSAGLKDRDARIVKIEALSNGSIMDIIAYYQFVEASGLVKVILKDLSGYNNITKITFRVYYIYTKASGSLKFINKPSEFKKNYKLNGRYKMKNYTYNLTDVMGKIFTKYDSNHPEDLITNTATCNNNTTVGIRLSYSANPYDIEQWVEKREIYYIPSDAVNPTVKLTSASTNILATSSSTAFFKRDGFVQNNSILTNIPYNFQTILIPRSFNNKSTFQETFKTNGNYEADAIRLLRGDIVNEEVFYNRRKNAMEDSLIGLMNGYSEDYSLTDEYLTSNGKDRVYNFAKGFSNMINQEALNVKDDLVNKRALQDAKNFTYQVVFEKKAYDSNNITTINNSTTEDQDKALLSYMQFSPSGSRELIKRLAESEQYPMNKLFEESYMAKTKRDLALANKQFTPERNTHLMYYNITKPKLDNSIKAEYANTTFDIARDMLYTGFNNLFFKDIFSFKELSDGVLNHVTKMDTDLPSGDTSVSYKVVYSNSQEEVDEITDLIRAIIKPNDGTKLEVYNGE